MFGISPLGWLHTLGSLPAIPVAASMFITHGRIAPRSLAGATYLVSMLIGAVTIFLVAHEPASYVIAAATLAFLILGYGAHRLPLGTIPKQYVETLSLTVTAFLLAVPTITEILTRVPDGHPWIASKKSPILLAIHGTLLMFLIAGLTLQAIRLRNTSRRAISDASLVSS